MSVHVAGVRRAPNGSPVSCPLPQLTINQSAQYQKNMKVTTLAKLTDKLEADVLILTVTAAAGSDARNKQKPAVAANPSTASKTSGTLTSGETSSAGGNDDFVAPEIGETFRLIDAATDGHLTRLVERHELSGKGMELVSLLAPKNLNVAQILLVGVGTASELNPGVAYRALAGAAKAAACKPRDKVVVALDGKWSAENVESAVAGAINGCSGQDLYRHEKKWNEFAALEVSATGDVASAVSRGEILGNSILLTRRLVNEPPQEINPANFADRAAAVAKEAKLECEIWDRARLEKEKCGSLLAVSKGSSAEPRLVQLRYAGGGSEQPWLALVGKGVTFDSGGLSLKPSDSMLTMKCDMAGAATVLGAINAIARLKLPINVIALMGLVENMTGSAAMKLGDVLTARSGKTIEVHNTDAEGRLVLADVLDVAVSAGAAKIVDLATLTGACMVALGTDVAGVMTNEQSWCDSVLAAAKAAGEPAWQLPMFPEYDEQIKCDMADIKNVGDGRWGGAITAAKFLEQFVAGKPWVHIDIAGPAFAERPKKWIDSGATGVYVRTLVELARAASSSKSL